MCVFCNVSSERHVELGRKFGYPECCIAEFVEDVETIREEGLDPRSTAQNQVARQAGIGFVPCRIHADQIVEGKTKWEDLVNPPS